MENKRKDNLSDLEMSICLSEEDKDLSPTSHVTLRKQRDQHIQHETDPFADFKEEMRKLMAYFTTSQKSELTALNSTLLEIKQSNSNIESSIQFLAEQNAELKTRVNELEEHAKDDGKYILFLENKLENLELGCRKSNFELKNVPTLEKEGKEELIDMITHLSKNISCDFSRSDIKDIYRVRGKKSEGKNSPIIVETNSALTKSDFLRKAKHFNTTMNTKLTARHLGFKTRENTPIYLSEHLTAKAARLHFLARDLKISKGYKFCWTNYGRVYVRKNDKSPFILIRSEQQVQHLMLEN